MKATLDGPSYQIPARCTQLDAAIERSPSASRWRHLHSEIVITGPATSQIPVIILRLGLYCSLRKYRISGAETNRQNTLTMLINGCHQGGIRRWISVSKKNAVLVKLGIGVK